MDKALLVWYHEEKGGGRMAWAEQMQTENHLTDEQVTMVVNFVKFLETQNQQTGEVASAEEVLALSDRLMEQNAHSYEVLAQ